MIVEDEMKLKKKIAGYMSSYQLQITSLIEANEVEDIKYTLMYCAYKAASGKCCVSTDSLEPGIMKFMISDIKLSDPTDEEIENETTNVIKWLSTYKPEKDSTCIGHLLRETLGIDKIASMCAIVDDASGYYHYMHNYRACRGFDDFVITRIYPMRHLIYAMKHDIPSEIVRRKIGERDICVIDIEPNPDMSIYWIMKIASIATKAGYRVYTWDKKSEEYKEIGQLYRKDV